MLEAEVKAYIGDVAVVEKALIENGFSRGKLLKEEDEYFKPCNKDYAKTDEALRIRITNDMITGQVGFYLTYKGPKEKSIGKVRKEHEAEFKDYKELYSILLALGFTRVEKVVKVRKYYHKNNVTACVDSVEGLGDFLELEIIVKDRDMINTATKTLIEYGSKLGIDNKDYTLKSYLELLLNKKL